MKKIRRRSLIGLDADFVSQFHCFSDEVEVDESKRDDSSRTSPTPTNNDVPSLKKLLRNRIHPRYYIIKIVDNPWFERLVVLIILTNMVGLAVDDPLHPDSLRSKLSSFVEPIFLCFFIFEMVLRMISRGVSYFRRSLNVIDCLINLISFVSLFSSSIANISALRSFRAVRIIRLFTHIKPMQKVVAALVQCMPKVFSVTLLYFFLLFVFSLGGIQLFSSTFRQRCYDGGSPSLVHSDGVDLCSRSSAFGHQCHDGICTITSYNPNLGYASFDNVFISLVTTFVMTTMEGWTVIMYYTQATMGWWVGGVFSVALMVCIAIFAQNLALAIVVNEFTSASSSSPLNASLTPSNEPALVTISLFLRGARRYFRSQWHDSVHIRYIVPWSERHQVLSTLLMFHIVYPFQYSRSIIASFVRSRAFRLFITVVILVSSISLAMRFYGMPSSFELALDIVGYIATAIFLTEMIIKIYGLGVFEYFLNPWDAFDCVVVIMNVLEIAVLNNNPTFQVFRMVRAFRVLKFIRRWKGLNELVQTIRSSLGAIVSSTVLLVVYCTIFGIVGFGIFGGKFDFENEEGGGRDIPDSHFDTLFDSVITCFRVLSGDNWNNILYDGVRSTNWAVSLLFFGTLKIIGTFMIMNVFIAVLLEGFSSYIGDEVKSLIAERKKMREKMRERLRSHRMLGRYFNNDVAVQEELDDGGGGGSSSGSSLMVMEGIEFLDVDDDEYDEDEEDEEENDIHIQKHQLNESQSRRQTLRQLLFSFCPTPYPSFLPRQAMRALLLWPPIQMTLLFCIILSSVCLIFDVDSSRNPDLASVLFYLDVLWLVIFAAEMCCRMFAQGIWPFRAGSSYFTDWWNVLDMIVVFSSAISIGTSVFEGGGGGRATGTLRALRGLRSLRTLRSLRAIRPLRAIRRLNTLRDIGSGVLHARRAILQVCGISLFAFFVFAVMGVSLFSGQFYHCNDSSITTESECIGLYQPPSGGDSGRGNMQEREWINPPNGNFDNVFRAMLTLFQVSTFVGWYNVAMFAMDAQDNQWGKYWVMGYFLSFILCCSFVVLNLFVGVVVESYCRHVELEKERKENVNVNEYDDNENENEEESVVRNPYLLKQFSLALSFVEDSSLGAPAQTSFSLSSLSPGRIHERLKWIVFGPIGELFVSFVILCNAIVLAMFFYPSWGRFHEPLLQSFNMAFAIFYVIELSFKLMISPLGFWKLTRNLFDFAVILLNVFAIVGTLGVVGPFFPNFDYFSPAMFSFLRILRLLYILQLIPGSYREKAILSVVYKSIPASLNVSLFIILIMFIYAIVGMALFGNLQHGESLNDDANFSSFPNAMLVLFRLITLDWWVGMLWDCMEGWTTNLIAPLYYISFILLVTLILSNLWIAVILNVMDNNVELSRKPWIIRGEDLRRFDRCWRSLVGNSKTMWVGQFNRLLMMVGPPLGTIPFLPASRRLHFVSQVDAMVSKEGNVLYGDVLIGLVRRTLVREISSTSAADLPPEILRYILRLRNDKENFMSPYSVKEAFAAVRVQRAWRDYVERKKKTKRMREMREVATGDEDEYDDDEVIIREQSKSQ